MFPLDKLGRLLKQHNTSNRDRTKQQTYEDYFLLPLDPDTNEKYDLNKVQEIFNNKDSTTRRARQSRSILNNLRVLDRLNVNVNFDVECEEETQPKRRKIENVKQVGMIEPSLDGLLIASKYHPTTLRYFMRRFFL